MLLPARHDLFKLGCLAAFVALVALWVLFVTGCAMPSLRVFQKTVDPKLADKPPQQIEAERRAAAFIREKSREVEPDAAAQVREIHEVATPLSASLGEPKKPVTLDDKDAVIAELRAGLRAEQKKNEQWRAFARKYANKELEGTGIDLAGPGALLGVAGIVALCVFVPGFLTFVLFVIRRLRGTVQQLAQGVEEYAIEHPQAASELKEYLSSTMDRATKAIVKREKRYLDHTNLQEAAARVAAQATPSS